MNAFRPDVIVPLLSVFLSGLLFLLFGAIYLTRLSSRPEYLAFSVFSFFLTFMMFATFWYQEAQRYPPIELPHHAPVALLALRLQLVGAFGTAGSFCNFVIYLLRQETARRRMLVGVNLLTVAMMAAAFSHAIVHLPLHAGAIKDMDDVLEGPLFPHYLSTLVAFVLSGLLILHWGLRSLQHQERGNATIDAEDRDHFDVLARYGRRILIGTVVLFGSGVIDVVSVLKLPPVGNRDLPFEMRFIGLTFFCMQIAGVLGVEIKRSESRKATLAEENHSLAALSVQRAQDMQHIHHDVGNKVISVQVMLECAIESASSGADRREVESGLSAGLDEIRSVNRLIEEMLYRAQVESGDQPQYTRREVIDLPAWMQRLIDHKRQAIEALKRRAVLREEEPPPDFVFRIEAHLSTPERLVNTISLEQIMTNLLDNAVKYSPDGGTITVALSEQADALCIRVCDEGDGIPPEDQPRIFDLRQRGSRAFSEILGKGIGLHHVRRLLEEQGGSITVESEGVPGKGTVFTLTLPKS